MTAAANRPHEWLHTHMDELLGSFKVVGGMTQERAEAAVHALIDIFESVEKIYRMVLPEVINHVGNNEVTRESLWDLREELRHVDYHVHDSGILDL